MNDNPLRFHRRETFSQRSMVRESVATTEFLIFGGALFWLFTSEHSQHLWVWFAVGFPLFLAYVFIGGYIRERFGLVGDNTR